jgi:hypothetical protein
VEDIKHEMNKRINVPNAANMTADYVFNTPELVLGHVMSFLDEWDMYNMIPTNKTCAGIITYHYKKKIPFLSMLSHWFHDHGMCCVCFGGCVDTFSQNELGMYCHRSCMPTLTQFYVNPGGIMMPVGNNVIAGKDIQYLYDTPSICVDNVSLTCRGYNFINSPTVYKALDVKATDSDYRRLTTLINDARTTEHIFQLYDTTTHVRVGNVSINVYRCFSTINPCHIHGSAVVVTVVAELEKLANDLSVFHFKTNKYYREHIKPLLYNADAKETKTWSSYLRICIPDLMEYTCTLLEYLTRGQIFRQPELLYATMLDAVGVVNNKLLVSYISKAALAYWEIVFDMSGVPRYFKTTCDLCTWNVVAMTKYHLKWGKPATCGVDVKDVFSYHFTYIKSSMTKALTTIILCLDKVSVISHQREIFHVLMNQFFICGDTMLVFRDYDQIQYVDQFSVRYINSGLAGLV